MSWSHDYWMDRAEAEEADLAGPSVAEAEARCRAARASKKALRARRLQGLEESESKEVVR